MKNLKHEELGLLDEYAGQCMNALLSSESGYQNLSSAEVAEQSFDIARCMLIERRRVLNDIEAEGLG